MSLKPCLSTFIIDFSFSMLVLESCDSKQLLPEFQEVCSAVFSRELCLQVLTVNA